MKHISMALATLAIAVSFCSCNKEKEGTYTPEQKLATVYVEETDNESGEWTTHGRFMTEKYAWEDDRLTSISYFHKGTPTVVETFNYDKNNRITGSTYSGSGYTSDCYSEYIYSGKKLSTINIYYKGRLSETYKFTHTNGKITHIDMELGQSSNEKQLLTINPLRHILPQQATEILDHVLYTQKNNSKNDFSYSFDLVWDKDNIASLRADLMDQSIKLSYTYDNKNNPYRGFLGSENLENSTFSGFNMFSLNNPLTINGETSAQDETNQYSATYSYLYDGEYPTKSTLEAPVDVRRYEYDENTGEYNLVLAYTYSSRTITEYVYAE